MPNTKYRITLVTLFSLTLFACGGGSSSNEGSAPTVPQPSTPAPTPAPTPTPTPTPTPPSTNTEQPNILLIISDDQGLDASAQYSYSDDLPNTPTLDSLAMSGIVYDNVWATPACTTTRGSMITGQHGVNSGVSYVPAVLDTNANTLQRYLSDDSNTQNYASAVIGKWHLGGGNSSLTHPADSGVDYFAGLLQGTVDSYTDWPLTINGTQTQSNEYHTSKITDLAIDWVADQDQPWFLWLAFVAPHTPFHLPPTDLHSRNNLSGTQEDINANKRDYYLAAIEAMDHEIGRLLDSLSTEQRDNTIIIFIGDNGTPAAVIDTSVYARPHSKGSLYEGGIRVPMIVSGNGVTRQNERESALVNSTDLFATIAQLAGSEVAEVNNSVSFIDTFSDNHSHTRSFNYSEFESSNVTGWTIRNSTHKLIEFDDGTQELYEVNNDLSETNDLLTSGDDHSTTVALLARQAQLIRSPSSDSAIDITDKIFSSRSANCADYVNQYESDVTDVNNQTDFAGSLNITVENGKCVFSTNAIPNHDFNDAQQAFPNDVSPQSVVIEVTATPEKAETTTALSLVTDNAILLNGVKVDILAAGCFGVGNGKIGCNDIDTPWRYDPMFASNGFLIDSHNAHAQPDGTYHYHGTPNAFYSHGDSSNPSPLIGFAADGFPIFGPYFDDNGEIRVATSSYRLKAGDRPSGNGNPGGQYDGSFRDDYEYVSGLGDLDECNGMTVNGVYGYYITDNFPYVIACFTGTPDASFNKR